MITANCPCQPVWISLFLLFNLIAGFLQAFYCLNWSWKCALHYDIIHIHSLPIFIQQHLTMGKHIQCSFSLDLVVLHDIITLNKRIYFFFLTLSSLDGYPVNNGFISWWSDIVSQHYKYPFDQYIRHFLSCTRQQCEQYFFLLYSLSFSCTLF